MSPPVLQKPRFFIEPGFRFFYELLFHRIAYFCNPLMKLRLQIILLCCFCLAGGNALLAQKSITRKDTTIPVDSTKFFWFAEDQFQYGNTGSKNPLLNRLDGFQDYHPRQASLGNAGAPEKQLALPGASPDAFSRGINNFSYFGYLPLNHRFYTSEKPYTKLQYILGQKQELNVSVIHAHPFGQNCNVAFGFDRTRSTGFYRRQNTNNTSVNLNGWYRSPGRRYALMADVYWTTANVAENGGIKRDSSFEFGTQLDRQLVSVNLSDATTKQRLRGAWVKQYWSFGKTADTLSVKSDSTSLRTKIQPSWALVHTFLIRDETYQYTDGLPASGFYDIIYNDSTATNDSTYLWRAENGLWLELFNQKKHDTAVYIRPYSGKIGVRQEFGEIKNDTIYRHFSNTFIDGNFILQPGRFGWRRFVPAITVKAWYVLSGYNQGDYNASFSFVQFGKYALIADASRRHPAFLYTNYSGNHFRWENDFSSSDIASVKLQTMQIFGNDWRNFIFAEAGIYTYSHPLYFDSTYLPAQYNGSVNAVTASLHLDIGTKKFRTRTKFTWNSIPSSAPIRLPELIVRESVYGDFNLFHSALKLQAGVDATWYSAYYADAYNPNIAQFYIQNSSEIGNYVYLDPWVSIKVKPVHIFIKADHVNAGLFGRKYFTLPHYPANDFALKFGMSWVFND